MITKKEYALQHGYKIIETCTYTVRRITPVADLVGYKIELLVPSRPVQLKLVFDSKNE